MPENPDEGIPDPDAPSETDTGPVDTPDTDTPETDTGPVDTPDTDAPDTDTPDTGPVDAPCETNTGPVDTPDTGPPDTDTPDTGPVDTDTPDTASARTKLLATIGMGAVLFLFLVALLLAGRRSGPSEVVSGALQTGVAGSAPVAGTEPPAEMAPIDGGTDTTPAPILTTSTPTTRKLRMAPTGPAGPLTNAPVDFPGHERYPALVVKIDNDDSRARPQAGLTLADVVYEEKVEGGITRFAAVFQGSDANPVGPVRSARSTDINIVGSLNVPLYSYSGANAAFEALIQEAPIRNVGARNAPGAYFRAFDRMMPHNLMANSTGLWSAAASNTPAPLWTFRSEQSPLPAKAAKIMGASFGFGGGTSVVWRWQAADKAFQREQNGRIHFDADNWPVQASNVIIQFVNYVDTGFVDTAGSPVPEAQLLGDGPGWVLTGGYAVPVNWHKKTRDAVTTFTDAANQPVPMLPGKTWVELVPAANGASIQWGR